MTYFINNRYKAAKYKTTENANKRLLILREDISGSAPQRNRLKIVKCEHDFTFIGTVGDGRCHKCGEWENID